MLHLFRTIILRHFRYEWGKLILAVMGVAIGVSVFVAIRIANTTAYRAFTSSLDAVAGRATLQAVSGDGLGFDERNIIRLRNTPGIEAAAPVVEQYALIDPSIGTDDTANGTPLLVFGIDLFAESKFRDYSFTTADSAGIEGLQFLRNRRAMIITEKLAGQYRLHRGDSIRIVANGRRISFYVANIVKAEGVASALGGNFALLDIASAQEVFDRIGKLDRVDLLVNEQDREPLKEYLKEQLPPNIMVQEPQARGAQTAKMLDAFDLNLTALAFIALFVAMFIIYNTMLTNTLRRRRELGIVRAVGGTRRTIIGLFLGEAALIGFIGSLIGLPLGILLAQGAVAQVMQTVTALYILTVAEQITVPVGLLLFGGGLGVGASILSALPAAIEASRTHPRETFSQQTVEAKIALRYRRIVLWCTLVLVLAWLASWGSQKLLSPLLGFISAGLVLVGFALLTPIFIRGADALFGRVIRWLFGVEGELANAWLMQSLGRASSAIAALMTAIAMLVGVSTMVGSFRQTVDYWLRQTIAADLYITVTANRLSGTLRTPMPDEVVRGVDAIPEAGYVDAIRRTTAVYQGVQISVSGVRFNLPQNVSSLSFTGGNWKEIMEQARKGKVIVSEGFGLRFGKKIGDTIMLTTPSGLRGLTIAGICYDYTTDAGTILMHSPMYATLFRDSSITNMALFLQNPALAESVRKQIEEKFAGKYSLVVYSNGAVRNEALRIFDQTFAITYALQVVAIIVAAIGVANTLAALTLERSREIGILKSIGGTSGQVRKMTLVQAGLIGIASQTLGVAAGLVLSAVLIYVINRVSFGWTIQFQLSPDVIAVSTIVMLVTALLSGIGPAGIAARKRVADVVRAE